MPILRWSTTLLILGLGCFSAAAAETLSLDEAFERFVQNSPLAAAERETLRIAEGRLQQSDVWANPVLSYNQEGFPLGEPDSGFDQQEFLLTAWQAVELGGKRGKRRRQAQLELDAARARYEDFLRGKRLDLSRLFVRVFHASRRREAIESVYREYRQILETHRKRYEMGEASGLAQMKMESEEIWYLVELSRTERELSGAWSELGALIGWEGPRPELGLTKSVESTIPELSIFKEEALASRPDLEAQRLESLAAEAALQLERAKKTPDLNLGGGFKRDFGQNSFFVGVELPLPVWDRREGAIGARLAATRRQANLARWKELWIGYEVERAYHAYMRLRTAARRLDTDLAQKLDRTVEITALSYREGEAGILDYLDALRVRRDAVLELNRLMQELHLSRLDLEASIGTSLDEIEP